MFISDEYAAGILDGEGCIGIPFSPNQTGVLYPRFDIAVAGVFPFNLVSALQDRFGGRLEWKHGAASQRRAMYGWKISGKGAHAFVKQVVPFLWIKKDQAQVFISAWEEWKQTRNFARALEASEDIKTLKWGALAE